MTIQSNQGPIKRTQRFDTRGLLVKTEDENQAELYSASYNDDGDMLSATRAGRGTTQWTLDSFGRMVQEDQNLGTNVATSRYQY